MFLEKMIQSLLLMLVSGKKNDLSIIYLVKFINKLWINKKIST